ncbi:MAG: NRDE family protein [Candidatus Binatia bacterium]
MHMCTLALYFQEFDDYPLIVAANRDEYFNRPSDPPEVLNHDPFIFGGKDLRAGGTWLGSNQYGLLAGILNQRSGTGAEPASVRSRGLLCLDILVARDTSEVCHLLGKQAGTEYRPFNLLYVNAEQGFIAYNKGRRILWIELQRGLHVLSNTSVYDPRSEKMERAYVLFSQAKASLERDRGNHRAWVRTLQAVLGDHTLAVDSNDRKHSLCVHTPSYGTVSSSMFLYAGNERRFYIYHAAGPPCQEDFKGPMLVEVS